MLVLQTVLPPLMMANAPSVVRLRGGNLRIEWPDDAAEVSLSGEAVTVGAVTWLRQSDH